MPLVRISLRRGKTPAYLRAVADGVHQALADTFSVPPDDRFQIIQQLDPDELIYDPGYLGMRRDDDFLLIDITASDWRDTAAKQALYKAVVDRLAVNPGVSPQNVMIVLAPNLRADWSFGEGRASYVEDAAS